MKDRSRVQLYTIIMSVGEESLSRNCAFHKGYLPIEPDCSAPRVAKSILAAFGDIELIDTSKLNLISGDHHELCNPVAAMHNIGLRRVRIEQHHLDLSAIARINETWRIETAHAVTGRKPAPR